MMHEKNAYPRNVSLTMPRSWNECNTEQLELISRIMLEQIERVDRYHPFDMRNVKIACFFVLSEIEIVEAPDESLPIDEQCYMCRFSFGKGKAKRSWLSKHQGQRHRNDPFPLYLWQLNYWLSPKVKTKAKDSVEYLSSGAGLLDWLDNNRGSYLTRFPYPTMRLRAKDGSSRIKVRMLRSKVEFEGVAQDMDGFSWRQYRFATDLMGQYTSLSNNLLRMQRMGTFTEEQIAKQANNVDLARAMFLATIFNRRIDYIDSNTNMQVRDFHYDTHQHNVNAAYFRHFPDHQWQPILFWWTGMMQTLSTRYPHVFKVQKLDRQEHPSTPLEIYTATIATMQKYASLTEDQINNQSYSLVLEHLERLSKENEEMEKIRKK